VIHTLWLLKTRSASTEKRELAGMARFAGGSSDSQGIWYTLKVSK